MYQYVLIANKTTGSIYTLSEEIVIRCLKAYHIDGATMIRKVIIYTTTSVCVSR